MPNENDKSVMDHIKELTAREEELYGKDLLTDAEVQEVKNVKAELDQYWDLLRQRRALKDAGEKSGPCGNALQRYD